MQLVEKGATLQKILTPFQKQGLSIGFVPTMGALHTGHLSLIRKSKKDNQLTVLSIFVNPTQFGPKEDFSKYPRVIEQDTELARKEQADILFHPSIQEVYPEGFSTFIEETEFSKGMCGAFRPGHFRGVCTVVHQLFQMVNPDRSYFGEKDAQQLRVLQKMTEDLRLPIQIVPCPIVRERDGLALSSRNIYLSEQARTIAPQIYKSLKAAQKAFEAGEKASSKLIEIFRDGVAQSKEIEIQYVELRRWRDWKEEERVQERSVLGFAGFLEGTRLIDNLFLG